jgi:hypothetical protein
MLRSGAEFSPCGAYRYTLTRQFAMRAPEPMVFVMLNPSTADAMLDDPTIRRCMGFAKREGYGGLMVVNLYALRATDPKALWRADDPVGPANWDWLLLACRMAAQNNRPVVCAWGAGAKEDRVAALLRAAEHTGARLTCLGKTKSGAPRHPLYLRWDAPLEAWP